MIVVVVVVVGRFFNGICNAVDDEEFEDTKGVIRIRKSKRTDNTMAKRKRTNNDLHNMTHKTKVTRGNMNPTKNRNELRCSGMVSSSCSTGGSRHVC